MAVKYDTNQYLASVRMSSKKRVLVEGKDDKAHIRNLVYSVLGDIKFRVDTAESIRGVGAAAVNNREKIINIHQLCQLSGQYGNLFLFVDREFLKFEVGDVIVDGMDGHEVDGNLGWTLGHSLENYFINASVLIDAFSFLTGSEFKSRACSMLRTVLPSALAVVAAITLASREVGQASYPAGIILWTDFSISEMDVSIDFESVLSRENAEIAVRFAGFVEAYLSVAGASDVVACERICRGHTAILMLQRIFSSCIYHAGLSSDADISRRDANLFSSIREQNISNALCEAWVRRVSSGGVEYPRTILDVLSADIA